MFQTKTAFVIGAGASKEFKLPVGSELAETIAQKCDIRYRDYNTRISGDEDLFESFRRSENQKAREFQQAAWAIRDGILLQNSIDDYLLSHKENQSVIHFGKAAIIRSIIESERSSTLFFDTSNAQKKLDIRENRQTWLVELSKLLLLGATEENLDNLFDNVCFISFNYDRCLEHFLLNAIQGYFQIPHPRASEVLSKARIIHPYGSVGPLHDNSPHTNGTPFGGRYYEGRSEDNFYRLANNIRVYTEDNCDYLSSNNIHEVIKNYDRVIFLGFGFHRQNIEILFSKHVAGYTPKIIATTYGMSQENIDYARIDLLENFHPSDSAHVGAKLMTVNEQCGDLFRRFNKMLAR